jgi:hypothetical protein
MLFLNLKKTKINAPESDVYSDRNFTSHWRFSLAHGNIVTEEDVDRVPLVKIDAIERVIQNALPPMRIDDESACRMNEHRCLAKIKPARTEK